MSSIPDGAVDIRGLSTKICECLIKLYTNIFMQESEATERTTTRTSGDDDLNLCYVRRADVETENVPSSHSEVRDSVVVGFEDFGIVENFISESV